ncbi:hypothetical protein TcasGA2_TC004686 [Tribolium castaneum]|uniref:Uncharacterized protein n=1 Tax=Tribolium castaneum TaxID=7070 RepID=D6W675_TRICA|nr:PREDICTED: uncharacterized protein LOC654960 isoform X1 [Tribolium castaneum]EFA11089.1 hypothetical protein TcasGA2_TC004686 [Tribolium castaneum]|eukprot:XP_975863.1 PREDICTED: uncharacterized protein LOC654960 isoform X1 [Tribolium castaneum]
MTDNYPEHLNPFADEKPRPKLTIRDSFKELKRNLRQSFRIKKKDNDEVTLRQKSETFKRSPLSYPSPQQEALPRSRFRERISTPGSNPFEEEEKRQNAGTTRRRGKKRAPLPPKSASSQNVSNLEASSDGSHWSLTSADTDCSFSTDNETKPDAMINEFKDFNKNMEALKDDSNNNVVAKEKAESNSNIPDLVISCPNEELEESDHLSVISEGGGSDLVVKDITSNLIEEKEDEVEVNYCEKKSLYIAGSRDDLNDSPTYTGRVSLYITGSCDDLDASNNNEVCNKSVTDENSIADAVPTPKQRKNKLSKNILLGTESVCN